MRETLALFRASWLAATSYRLNMLLSIASLAAVVVPLYFITGALQPMMASRIAQQGPQYFAFALVGAALFSLASTAASALPGAIGGAIGQGTLEAMFATPARTPALLAGLSSYQMAWAVVRAVVVIGAGVVLGMHVEWSRAPIAVAIAGLVVVAYAAVGVFGAALVVRFRAGQGALLRGVLTGSMLLGGVYYPTTVIPSWIQKLSALLPLTYGLRALRAVLLAGAPLRDVARDVAVLTLFALGLFALAALALAWALRDARREGTLSQY